jgi:hypothetical protein
MIEKKVIPRPTASGNSRLIWTDAELKTEFEPILEEQAKLYDADYEWERGWSMYPNHRGVYRLVVSFDSNYKARSDQLLDIDPRPRCWTVVYTNKSGRTGLVYGYGSRNFFETLEEARAEFGKTALDIERDFTMKEITKLSVRKAQCASCSKVHDWDEEKQAYYGMWNFMPHKEFDETYDGCKGWD